MESKIVGTVLPVLELTMQPSEKVFAESGELAWMSMAIQMKTGASVGGQQGGFLGGLGRALAGGTLFMTVQHLAHAIQEYLLNREASSRRKQCRSI